MAVTMQLKKNDKQLPNRIELSVRIENRYKYVMFFFIGHVPFNAKLYAISPKDTKACEFRKKTKPYPVGMPANRVI